MSDRLDLIARLGAAITNADGATRDVLRDALAAIVEDQGLINAVELRKEKDRKRKRGASSPSTDSTESTESVEFRRTPPPQVSLLSPRPPYNSSFPPTPHHPPREPQGAEEIQLHDRAPEAWPSVLKLIAGKDTTAARAWVGRCIGALDRPPHPTGGELREAIEDFLTEPDENRKPTLFRRYVERIRRDAERDAERAAAPTPAISATATSARERGDDAANVLAAIRELIQEVKTPGNGIRRFIPAAAVEQLGPRAAAAYRAIGGAERILNHKPDELGYLIRDFATEYRRAARITEKVPA